MDHSSFRMVPCRRSTKPIGPRMPGEGAGVADPLGGARLIEGPPVLAAPVGQHPLAAKLAYGAQEPAGGGRGRRQLPCSGRASCAAQVGRPPGGPCQGQDRPFGFGPQARGPAASGSAPPGVDPVGSVGQVARPPAVEQRPRESPTGEQTWLTFPSAWNWDDVSVVRARPR